VISLHRDVSRVCPFSPIRSGGDCPGTDAFAECCAPPLVYNGNANSAVQPLCYHIQPSSNRGRLLAAQTYSRRSVLRVEVGEGEGMLHVPNQRSRSRMRRYRQHKMVRGRASPRNTGAPAASAPSNAYCAVSEQMRKGRAHARETQEMPVSPVSRNAVPARDARCVVVSVYC